VPNRYMHSPNEVVSLEDLRNTAGLLAAFIRQLGAETDFTPR
jgi:putative aminopeptidase FrvX